MAQDAHSSPSATPGLLAKESPSLPTSLYHLPPELRQMIYNYVLLSTVTYPTQAYYHLHHSPQTPIWCIPTMETIFRIKPSSAAICLLWETENQNHGFAYSQHVRRAHLRHQFFAHPLCLTSSLIRTEASHVLAKISPPPLAVWRDFSVDMPTQMSAFLSRMTAALLAADVSFANITVLNLHSQFSLRSCTDFSAWVATELPALRTLHLVLDVSSWHSRATVTRRSNPGGPPRRTFWHLRERAQAPLAAFHDIVKCLLPLAIVARAVVDCRVGVVVPRGGLCVCENGGGRRRRLQCDEVCKGFKLRLVDGERYAALMADYLRAVVVMFEVGWFAMLKGKRRRCDWNKIAQWICERLTERRITSDVGDLLLRRGIAGERGQSGFDADWLWIMTGRRVENMNMCGDEIVMASNEGQEFGWARTTYSIEKRW